MIVSIFANMPIARRLSLAIALAALVPGIIIAILGGSYLTTLNSLNKAVQASDDAVKLVTDQQANILRMDALSAALPNSQQPSDTVEIKREISALMVTFSQETALYEKDYQIESSVNMQSVQDILRNNGLDKQVPVSQHSLIFIVDQQWQAYKNAQNAILRDPGGSAGASKLATDLEQVNLEYLPLKGNIDNLVNLTESLSQVIVRLSAAQIMPLLIGTIVAFLCSILIVSVIGYIINLTITRPLRQLSVLTNRISRGETNVRATVTGYDEINQVAASMNQMLDNIVLLMQETQMQRDNLQASVERLASEVSSIGEGNLSIQAQVTADTLGALARSFNYMVRELGSLVVRVKRVAHEVELLTSTTLERMNSLVSIGEHQIEQITASTSEIEHMAEEAIQVAERTHVLSHIAVETHQTANKGRAAVQRIVEGIGRIHENMESTSSNVQLLGMSSQEITNIVTVISNIAYQTNRLSLDASIQAAMAGENGKGFAAVASDIRRLAEQTKEQASMIAAIIRTAQENITKSAKSMQDTELETSAVTQVSQEATHSLLSIFDVVEKQAREIESINLMAAHQLETTKKLVATMQNISMETRNSSDSTKDASRNMWRLALLVEQLRQSVEAFKLPDAQNYLLSNPRNVTRSNTGDLMINTPRNLRKR
jgi:methyl-accepting chemotaxis protein